MPQSSLTMAEFDSWLSAFSAAWEAKDPEGAVGLFSATASVQAGPFAPMIQGRKAVRDWWRREIVEGQVNPAIEVEPWIVFDATGICRMRGRVTLLPNYQRMAVDGVLRAQFRLAEGETPLCARLSIWSETAERASTG